MASSLLYRIPCFTPALCSYFSSSNFARPASLVAKLSSSSSRALRSNSLWGITRPDFPILDQRLRELVTRQTSFSLRLSAHLTNLRSANSNLAFSPLSMHSLLSFLTAGTVGPTHQQLLSFLGSSIASELSTLYSHLSNIVLADGSAVGGPHLSYAGGLWVDDNTNLKNSFREVARSIYKAEAQPVPFRSMPEKCRNEINKWFEQKTAGHIKELLPSRSIDETTPMVLGNAIYFKGSWPWYAKFDSRYTATDKFHLSDGSSVETLFMASGKKQFISAYDGFKVLKLPYEKGQDWRQFSFYIFLPDAIDGLLDLSMKLSTEPDFLNQHIATREVPVGDFKIPKFKISVGTGFKEILQKLGLVLPFTRTGDFSGMIDSSEYFVSDILHKCFVEINEEGTEAAAASAALYGSCREVEKPIDFVADHPFLFLIREDSTGAVLFTGHLLNPLLAE